MPEPARLGSLTPEQCPQRQPLEVGGAECLVLEALFGAEHRALCRVSTDVCTACCRSFSPTPTCLNPVLASRVFTGASQLLETASEAQATAYLELRALAQRSLDVEFCADPAPSADPAPRRLQALPPLPASRTGAVRQWAVGVTTAPRIHATLDRCLTSMSAAGWSRPHLFIDVGVRLDEPFRHLPYTLRTERAGAWPNYYLALAELVTCQPEADAYLMVQDDALFYAADPLVTYLENVLWPGAMPALVSLYCSPADAGPTSGWHPRLAAISGPVAMVFPRPLALDFLTDPIVLQRCRHADPTTATSLGDVLAAWAHRQGQPIWFPTPSLVQHIGDTSTLWPQARALGPRRAAQFAGD